MKKILLSVFLFTSMYSVAQVPTGVPVLQANRYYRFTQYVRVDSGLMIPYRDTTYRPLVTSVLVRPQDGFLYYWNSSRWVNTSFSYSFFTTQANGSPSLTAAGGNVTMNIPNAGPLSTAGTVTNQAQIIAGGKTFTSSVSLLGTTPLYYAIEPSVQTPTNSYGGGVRWRDLAADSASIVLQRYLGTEYVLSFGSTNQLLSPKISLSRGAYSLGYSTFKNEYYFDVNAPIAGDSSGLLGFAKYSWLDNQVFGVDKRGSIFSTGIDSTIGAANMLWWDPVTKTIKRSAIPAGTSESMSNIGTGFGFYESKVGSEFRMKTLTSDATIQRTNNASSINLGVIPNTHVQRSEFRVAGTLLGTRKSVSFNASGGITLTGSDDAINDRVNITIAAPAGEVVTMSNLPSTGVGVYRSKDGSIFNMKKIYGTGGTTIVDRNDSIEINSTGTGGGAEATIENGAPTKDTLVKPISLTGISIKSHAPGWGMLSANVTDSTFGEMADSNLVTSINRHNQAVASLTNLIYAVGTSVENGAPFTADTILFPLTTTSLRMKSFSRGFGLSAFNITDSTFGARVDTGVGKIMTWAGTYKIIDSVIAAGTGVNIYNASGTLTGVGDRTVTLGAKNLTFDASSTGDLSFTLGGDATGDIYYRNSSGRIARLPIGTAGYSLHVDAGLPAWQPDATGGGSGVTSVGLSAFTGITVTNSPITSVGTIALSTTLNGMLYGTGSGFAVATISSPLLYSAGTLSIQQVNTSQPGYLSDTDWDTFNGKQDLIAAGSASQFYAWDKTMKAITTAMVSESGNLYYLDSRARAALSATSPLTYNSGTGVFGISIANTTQDGYLSSANWNTFNLKQQAIQFQDEGVNIGTSGGINEIDFTGSGLVASVVGGKLTIAGTGAAGGEANTGTNVGTGAGVYRDKTGVTLNLRRINGTGAISVTENANDITVATTALTSVGLSMPAGFSASGPLTSNGTINVTTALSGMIFANGSGFAAATISGPLTYAAGTLGIQQGTTAQNGFISSTDWNLFNGKQNNISTGTTNQFYGWDKTMRDITTNMVGEGSNLYYTDGRARLALSGTSPIIYNNITGNISAQYATTSLPGVLSSTDWNTFNSRANTAANLGGTGLFSSKNGTTLEFKGLTSASTISLSPTSTTVGLEVIDNTSTQKIQAYYNGALVGTRKAINIIPSGSISATVVDNGASDRVDITLNAPGVVFASKGNLTAASGYNFCYVKGVGGSFEISDKVLKMGHGTNDDQRTITISSMLYVSSFSTGGWVHVATIPAGYRPSGLVSFPVSDVIPGIANPATTPIRAADGSTGITNGCVYTGSSGYIDPDNGFVYIRLQSITSLATLGGGNVVVLPINITYFINVGT